MTSCVHTAPLVAGRPFTTVYTTLKDRHGPEWKVQNKRSFYSDTTVCRCFINYPAFLHRPLEARGIQAPAYTARTTEWKIKVLLLPLHFQKGCWWTLLYHSNVCLTLWNSTVHAPTGVLIHKSVSSVFQLRAFSGNKSVSECASVPQGHLK